MRFTIGLAICLTLLFAWKPATALEFAFHTEPAAAFWADEPQSNRFTPGFYIALRPSIILSRYVALQWSYAFLITKAKEGFTENGSAHFLLGGVRIRPLASLQPVEDQLGGLFVDFNLGYVRTGDLNRFAFDAGIGYGFQMTPWLSMGPVIRYTQIMQPDDNYNQNPEDAHFFTVGLDLAFGTSHKEKDKEVYDCPEAPQCIQKPIKEKKVKEIKALPCYMPCPDADQDGVCDADDRCPKKIGPASTFGCPVDPCGGEPLLLLVQFEYDSDKLPPPMYEVQTMYPILDEIAAVISQDKTCRVCIIGYASEEGEKGYNKELSKMRAASVKDYLVTKGVSESKLPSIGMGEKCQLIPETTHILNRRVEFRRLEEGEKCPNDCSTNR
ncbi:MAG TPA: OmpA family protein [bacterium]|nr:OmpA family protein [bacterium]HPS31825.1 OmpA family protein [bacterium]